jgi:hypothetical protein
MAKDALDAAVASSVIASMRSVFGYSETEPVG